MQKVEVNGTIYEFPDNMKDDDITNIIHKDLGIPQPNKVSPIESAFNAFQKSMTSEPASSYLALAQQYDKAQEILEAGERAHPSSGFSGMVGSAVGGVAQMAPALIPPLAPYVIGDQIARATGNAFLRSHLEEEETGEEISTSKKLLNAAGAGAINYVMTKIGLSKIEGALGNLEKNAIAEVGEAIKTGSSKEIAKAIGKHVVPTITAMGVWNGGQEGFTQAAENALDKLYTDRPLLENVPEAFGIGAMTGAFLAPIGAARTYHEVRTSPEIKELIDRNLEVPAGVQETPEIDVMEGHPINTGEVKKAAPSKPYRNLTPGDKKYVANYYNKYLKEYYGGRAISGKDAESRLSDEERDSVVQQWEMHKEKKVQQDTETKAKIVTPANMRVVPATTPVSELKPMVKDAEPSPVVDGQLQPETSTGIADTEKPKYIGGELYFQQSDGQSVRIPITDESVTRMIERVKATGLVNNFVFHKGAIWHDKDGNIVEEGTKGATAANGAWSPVDRVMHLSDMVMPNTVGHELFESVWNTLEKLNDPVIARGLEQFGGKERIADIEGNFFAANEKYDNPGLMRQFAQWLRGLWTAYKARVGKDISADELGSYINAKIRKEYNRTDWMPEEGMSFQDRDVSDIQSYFDQQQRVQRQEKGFSLRQMKSKFMHSWVDTAHEAKNILSKLGPEGQRAIIHHDLIAGSVPAAIERIKLYRKGIWDGLSSGEYTKLNQMIEATRTITLSERYPEMSQPGGHSAEKWRKWIASVPTSLRNKLQPRMDAYFKAYEDILSFGLSEQLITKEAYDKMKAVGPYSPRQYMNYIDPVTTTIRRQSMGVRDSGFAFLKEGSEDFLNGDLEEMLYQTTARLIARAQKNRANRELLTIAKNQPDNPLVRVRQKGEKSPIIPKGYVEVGLFIDGKQETVFMQEDMAKSWITSDPMIRGEYAKFTSWLMGTTPLKAMATGLNPAFAIANFPRDLAHIYLTTNEYSSNLVQAMPQLTVDLVATAKDAWTKTGSYKNFIEQGGGTNLLTHQGRIGMHKGQQSELSRNFQDLEDVLGKLGEFSELWTRLALRNRALKNGKDETEATYIARNYLDFSQGGSYSKAYDSYIPYLNASIQGTRGIFRAAKREPGKFAWKVTQLGAVSASLAMANALVNPEIWDSIDEDTKDKYFVITRPELTYKDKDGNTRYVYMKIAKDQGQRMIATVFESIAMMLAGKPVDNKRLAQACNAILPIVPDGTLLPPTVDAIIGYVFNKDFFRNQDIWKGEELSKPSLEFTASTNPAYRKATELPGGENLSPERLRYAVNQVFVPGNPMSWLVGSGFKAMIKDMPGEKVQEVTQELATRIPGVSRIFSSTYPNSKYQEDIKKMKKEANTATLERRRELDAAAMEYIADPTAENKAAVNAIIAKAEPRFRPAMRERVLWNKRLYNQPNRQWWMSIAPLSPDMRAMAFYAKWKDESPEERELLLAQSRKIPGVASPRFRLELRRLMNSSIQNLNQGE